MRVGAGTGENRDRLNRGRKAVEVAIMSRLLKEMGKSVKLARSIDDRIRGLSFSALNLPLSPC